MDYQQLALKMNLREETTFANFYEGNNQAVVAALKASLENRGEKFIYLSGPLSVGKTHLLQACCHFQESNAMYLSLKTPELVPGVLQSLEKMPLVCLDDIEAIFGDAHWEEALLHFYNRARENRISLFVASVQMPTQSTCQLADLRSRLSWGLFFQVKPLTDTQKVMAIRLHAEDRGLEFPDEVGEFLLRHFPRDMSVLFDLLDRLDGASFISQRKLTVPFVKQVLGI